MWALVLAAVAIVTGCSEQLTYERWQTLTPESSKAEVRAVLGQPNEWEKDDTWMYYNPDKDIAVTVEFTGGDTLTYSRWVDHERGSHEIGTAAIESTDLMQRDTSKTDIDKP